MAERARDDDALPAWLAATTSTVLVTGVYAWAVTVLPVASLVAAQAARTGLDVRSGIGTAAAILAIVPVLAGAWIERSRPDLATRIGVWGFLGLATTAWLLVPAAVDLTRVDPGRGLLGGGGFALYALAWGVPRVFRRAPPEANPRADTSMPLEARDRLPRAALPIAAVGIASAIAIVAAAWHVRDVPRALFAQALAGCLCVVVLSAAARVAVGLGRWSPPSPRARLRRATTKLFFFFFVAIGYAAFALLVDR